MNPDSVDDPNYWVNKQKLATPIMKPQNNYYSTSVYSMDEAVAPKELSAAANNISTKTLRTGPYVNNEVVNSVVGDANTIRNFVSDVEV